MSATPRLGLTPKGKSPYEKTTAVDGRNRRGRNLQRAVRAEDQNEAPAAVSEAPAETAAPSAPAETSPPAAESKPVIPPDSEWVHPTK